MKRFLRNKLFKCPYADRIVVQTGPNTFLVICWVAKEPIPNTVWGWIDLCQKQQVVEQHGKGTSASA